MKLKLLYSILFCSWLLQAHAQFAPPAGQLGTSAIHKDSSAFVAWATGCSVTRGLQDISDPGLGYASVGDNSMALGIAGSNGVVSLGDSGSAIMTFANAIVNGTGYDFAIFENSFSDDFLELGFVEVSSDGINYFRFPSTSLTDPSVQIGGFGQVDATKINNLAGKYRALYGTPFDLEELKNEIGLNVNNISHIRIIDVVGCIQNAYASYDNSGNKINDPWSTPFASSGFDLDAVGVINSIVNAVIDKSLYSKINVYPNPLRSGEHISLDINYQLSNDLTIQVFDATGQLMKEHLVTNSQIIISTEGLSKGIYILKIADDKIIINKKIIITE